MTAPPPGYSRKSTTTATLPAGYGDKDIADKAVADFNAQGPIGRLGTGVGDMVSAGVHGLTFGADDRAAAGLHTLANNVGSTLGLSDDIDYNQALAQEQGNTKARQARMDSVTPGASGTFEALGSLGIPQGLLAKGLAKAGVGGSSLVKAIANTLENSGYGAASAYGHGQDPLKGAAFGAAGTALQPLLRWGAPVAARLGLPAAGAATGGTVAGYPGAWAGAEAGKWAGRKVGAGMGNAMDTNAGRDALATLAAAPGRLYGWATGR